MVCGGDGVSSVGAFKHDQLWYRPVADSWTVLSLTQPWAAAIFDGRKAVETRGWRTNYRGRLYIQAAKGFPKYAKEFAAEEGYDPKTLPVGVILGHVCLVDVQPTSKASTLVSALEMHWGDYSERRFAWFMRDPVLLDEPIPAKGSLGLWQFTRPSVEVME